MTTQPEIPAVGSEPIAPVLTAEERLNAAFGDEPEQPEQDDLPAEGETPEAAEDELEIEAEAAEELPPIEAPVSWDAEAKAVFAGLPREAQEIVQKREADRERFVQAKSQEAARAVQTAEQQASLQYAQALQQQAQQYEQLAQQIMPQEPDPAMLSYDPQGFYLARSQFEGAQAQQRELQQRAYQAAQEATQRAHYAEQAELAAQYQILADQFPEYTDPTTGPKVQAELSAVARELGYPPELIEQARAPDILAMKTAASWKADAEKYRALMSKQMSKVRAAKGLAPTAKPGSAQAPGAARQQRYSSDRDAMRRGDRDATVRVLDSFFDNKS